MKFKEIASAWWDSLSAEGQKSYIETHPNSKFTNKANSKKDRSSLSDLKNKDKLKEHLKDEGVDITKPFSKLSEDDKQAVTAVKNRASYEGSPTKFYKVYLGLDN
jgi:hypothetical protein